MSIISWIVVGLIAGWLAGLVMGGRGYGFWADMLLGIVGALLGGFLAHLLFGAQDALTGINLSTLLVAFIGAVIVVALSRAFRRRPVV
jgi:uncharacterized membrane protein YeaQ/YmgE (transglycosylase-associated protein family)